MEAEKRTLIDAQSDMDGTLKGKDATVQGRFQGTIELTGRLVLTEGSRVEAQVVAEAAEIGGQFKGDLKVKSLVLHEKARVDATLETQTLSVREGAQLNGSVKAGTPPPVRGTALGLPTLPGPNVTAG